MNSKFIEKQIDYYRSKNIPIAAIISVLSTTEFGTIDPLTKISKINKKLESKKLYIWNHLDAAYGGFLLTLKDDLEIIKNPFFKNMSAAKKWNSITIDPHKLGYIPYSSGTFICKDPLDYYYQKIDAPYVDFHKKFDLGPQTIEGSRSATGVTATWLSANTIGFNKNGLGQIINKSVKNKLTLEAKIRSRFKNKVYIPKGLHSNILCFAFKNKSRSLKAMNRQTLNFYKKLSSKNSDFIVSKTSLDINKKYSIFSKSLRRQNYILDDTKIVFIRLCLMNPFFKTKEPNTQYSEEFMNLIDKC